MKKRLFSILVAVFVLVLSTNAFAISASSTAAAWLQTSEEYADGLVETEVKVTAVNGVVTLVSGSAPTALNVESPVQFKFTANPGFILNPSWDKVFIANVVGGYASAQMQALFPGSAASDSVTPDLDLYYDLLVTTIGTPTTTEVVLEVNVVRNEVEFLGNKMTAHLEPELSVDIKVYFYEPEPTPPPPPVVVTYTVSSVSNPSGVATFIGTGSGFTSGSNYAVYYTLVDSDYEFVDWTGTSEGVISGNVNLIANFRLKTYDVTAVSSPVGVGTFTGVLSDVADGTEYNVLVDSIAEGYEFVEWLDGAPSGIVEGADVRLVAVFQPIPSEVDLVDDETPLDIESNVLVDEELPEAGGAPMLVFGSLGLAFMAIGRKLRK